MIFSCTRHVKEGLKIMDLPHVYTISGKDSVFVQESCCHFCGRQAKYKLFNYSTQRRNKKAI